MMHVLLCVLQVSRRQFICARGDRNLSRALSRLRNVVNGISVGPKLGVWRSNDPVLTIWYYLIAAINSVMGA